MAQSIDLLYERAVKKLSDDGAIEAISKKLLTLKTNSERTLYIYRILKNLKVLPEIVTIAKTESVSEKYRELGNDSFKRSRDYEALQYYNMSLQHAPRGSIQLCLAYANRSAVLFALKRYNECLKDIDTVFSMNYPDKLKNKLLNRQQQCRTAAPPVTKDNIEENIGKVLKGMPSKNPRYICASSKVEVFNSAEMGRHVIAVDDIEPGEMIADEEPYVRLLLRSKALVACNYCLSFSPNLVPCDKCCVVLFCSENCKSEAVREYHSVECAIGATLIAMDFTKLELLALRTTIKARTDRPDWKSLLNLIDKVDKDVGSGEYGLVEADGSLVYDSKYYDSIHTLATNAERRSVSDIFQKGVTAAVLLHLVSSTGFLREGAWGVEAEVMGAAGGLLLQHSMTSPTNMHTVCATTRLQDGTCTTSAEVGSAAYAFLSLINHSCAPNVVRFNPLGTARTLLVALRPIKKGCQLFDNYGYHHALQVRSERRASLKFQYKFECACEACRQDWPLYLGLLPTAKVPSAIRNRKERVLNASTIEGLQNGDLNIALESFRPLCDMTNILEAYVPCAELGECQEAVKQCMFIISGILPCGYSKPLNWVDIVMNNSE